MAYRASGWWSVCFAANQICGHQRNLRLIPPDLLIKAKRSGGGGARLRGGDFPPFGAAGLAEITEPALFERAIRQLQRDLRRPPGFGLGHAFHDAHGAGNFVDHGFAQITFTRSREFDFAHGRKRISRLENYKGRWFWAKGGKVERATLKDTD